MEDARTNDLSVEEPQPRDLSEEEPTASPAVELPPAAQRLLQLGRERGYVTTAEILKTVPRPEKQTNLLDEVYAELFEAGIEVREESPRTERRAPVPTPAEEEKEDLSQIDDPVRLYLQEIGRVPLLTLEEEIELGRRVVRGNLANEALLAMEAREKLSADEESPAEVRLSPEERQNRQALIEQGEEAMRKLSPDCPLSLEELEQIAREGEKARQRLTEANLRLVVSVAKRYIGRGMSLLDLIQEGNVGLLRAVEKFDYTKGYKFSTYATWWIRQAISRALADQARTIRIPVHMVELINRLTRASRRLQQALGRDPTPKELAEEVDLPLSKVLSILKTSMEPVSLEMPVGQEEDSHLGEFIEDETIREPDNEASRALLREQLRQVLDSLNEREREVLAMRFGLTDGRSHTLEEVGEAFGVTRERIRQIEVKALRKLRHPTRSKKLRDYLET